MSFLEKLFNGEIHPTERYVKKGSNYDKTSKRLADFVEQLLSTLSDDERALFEKIERTMWELSQIEGKELFMEGLQLGWQLTMEIPHYTSPDFEQ